MITRRYEENTKNFEVQSHQMLWWNLREAQQLPVLQRISSSPMNSSSDYSLNSSHISISTVQRRHCESDLHGTDAKKSRVHARLICIFTVSRLTKGGRNAAFSWSWVDPDSSPALSIPAQVLQAVTNHGHAAALSTHHKTGEVTNLWQTRDWAADHKYVDFYIFKSENTKEGDVCMTFVSCFQTSLNTHMLLTDSASLVPDRDTEWRSRVVAALPANTQ